MKYNFDEVVDRKNTNSIKYDFAKERGKPEDLLPLWVADMDFKAPKEVLDILENRMNHGIFGYSEPKSDYFNAIYNWMKKYHNWEPKEDWLVKTPGIVFAIAMAIRAFTKEGEAVLIQKPVYYPFSETILSNNRRLVDNTLVYEESVNEEGIRNISYKIDFEDFEQKIIDEDVKLFVLCSPHNPVGRIWTKDELQRIATICLKHNVIVFSDEIHIDFVYPKTKHTHTVLASLNSDIAENCIIATAPSKTVMFEVCVTCDWVGGT